METMKGFMKTLPLILLSAVLMVGIGNTGCKKKKELAAAEAAAEAKLAADIAKATEILQSILEDTSLDNIDDNMAKLQAVKDMNLQDPKVLSMIIDVQEKLNRDKDALAAKLEAERLEAERLEAERLAAEKAARKDYDLLNVQFKALADEEDVQKSNVIIGNILPMFASKDVPVLIIIAEEDGLKDYDKPTNIDKYLNYLKDKKAYKEKVENIVYDDSGKIKELELRKK
jgi:hypothetical protein